MLRKNLPLSHRCPKTYRKFLRKSEKISKKIWEIFLPGILEFQNSKWRIGNDGAKLRKNGGLLLHYVSRRFFFVTEFEYDFRIVIISVSNLLKFALTCQFERKPHRRRKRLLFWTSSACSNSVAVPLPDPVAIKIHPLRHPRRSTHVVNASLYSRTQLSRERSRRSELKGWNIFVENSTWKNQKIYKIQKFETANLKH